jgi:hypothetical protein
LYWMGCRTRGMRGQNRTSRRTSRKLAFPSAMSRQRNLAPGASALMAKSGWLTNIEQHSI